MVNEQLWLLLSLKLSGEASRDELEALNKMLAENPQWSFQAELFIQMWNAGKKELPATDENFNRHLQRLSLNHDRDDRALMPVPAPEEIPEPRLTVFSSQNIWRFLAAASVVLGCFFIYRAVQPQVKTVSDHPAHNTVITKRGSKSNIQLPDGTTVWLNADTKIKYDEKFRDQYREVELEGEAFFDVVKDPQRPFIIHTKTVDIRVLGTAFNVRAYATEKNTETSLIRGEVEVTLHRNPEKKIVLKPNEKLLVNNEDETLVTGNGKPVANKAVSISLGKVHFEKKDSMALEAMWIKNKLVFDAERLQEVVQKIERWYDVKVVIEGDENVKKTEYSAIFDNETLAQVLEALKFTGNFEYTITKNQVNIR